MINVTAIIFLAFVASRCQGLYFDLHPSLVKIDTTANITLECRLKEDDATIDKQSINIRMLKQDLASHWHVIAEMDGSKPGVTVYEDNIVSGHIENLNDSYLIVTWPLPAVDILGSYRCDVVGFSLNQDIIQGKTQEVIISKHNSTLQAIESSTEVSKNLEYIIQKLGDITNDTMFIQSELLELIEKTDKIHENQINETEIGREDLQNLVDKVGNIENILIKLNQTINSQLFSMKGSVRSLIPGCNKLWPEGSFGLMATSAGCPTNNSDTWYTGYRKHHTESSSANHDEVSPNNHFQQPVIEEVNNETFMYQRFCIMNASSGNYFWPKGSYCINKFKFNCPGGFDDGYVHWDDEKTNHSSSVGGILPLGAYYDDEMTIRYCCRADGPATTGLELPSDTPFYLYRFRGQCQEVAGMRFTEEYLLFDTENTGNSDSYWSSNHPDGQAHNDVKLELCYYFTD